MRIYNQVYTDFFIQLYNLYLEHMEWPWTCMLARQNEKWNHTGKSPISYSFKHIKYDIQ